MYDMTIRLRTDSDKCLYQQIYEHIRQESGKGSFWQERGFPPRVLWQNICRWPEVRWIMLMTSC